MNRAVAVVIAVATLVACSGRGVVPPSPGGPPPDTAQSVTRAKIHAAVVIRVPKRKHRRERYVSPNSQSGTLSISPASGCAQCSPASPLDFGLTSASTNCVLGGDGLTCTIPLVLRAGKYVGTIALYDGKLAAGVPTGNVLSENQSFPMTVAPGASNVPTITLDGVPVAAYLLSLDGNAYVSSTNPLFPEMIQAAAGTKSRLEVYAVDPDGDAILGPGSPSFTLTDSGGFAISSLGNNIYLLAAPLPERGTSKVNLTISSPSCSEPDAYCSSIDGYDVVAATDGFAASSNGTTTAYVGGATFPTTQIVAGISGPGPVAFDSKADLFVGNQNANDVTEYAFPYTGGPIATIATGIETPDALAFDAADNLYVANALGDVEIYAAGNYTGAPAAINGSASAYDLAFDSAGRLWVEYATQVVRYPTPLTNADEDQTLSLSATQLCLTGPSDDLFVISSGKVKGYYLNGATYAAAPVQPSFTGVTSIACFNGGQNQDIVAVNAGSIVNYMAEVSDAELVATSSFSGFGASTSMVYDQFGTLYGAQGNTNSVRYYNEYVQSGYYFAVPNAGQLAAFP